MDFVESYREIKRMRGNEEKDRERERGAGGGGEVNREDGFLGFLN